MTPREFAEHFTKMAATFEVGHEESLREAAKLVEAEAKSMIGEYQTGIQPFQDWPTLAPMTLFDKRRLGYSPPDKPLERTEQMRNSIEHSVGAWEAHIGSDSQVAVDQELGTTGPHPIKPRSFLGGAVVRKADEIAGLIWGASYSILAGAQTRMWRGAATWFSWGTGGGW